MSDGPWTVIYDVGGYIGDRPLRGYGSGSSLEEALRSMRESLDFERQLLEERLALVAAARGKIS